VVQANSRLFGRRQNKLTSVLTSAFTSAFVFHWSRFFDANSWADQQPLHYPPVFDGRCVLYPSRNELIDYLKWRAVDCHINNVYNTTFYALTQQYVRWRPSSSDPSHTGLHCTSRLDQLDRKCSTEGDSCAPESDRVSSHCVRLEAERIVYQNAALTPNEAERRLQGSVSKQKKDDILLADYSIDYDQEPAQFRRGSLIVIDRKQLPTLTIPAGSARSRRTLTDSDRNNFKQQVHFEIIHDDLILDHFWTHNPQILDPIQLT
jgi:tRNA(His) 5'-end guanylyltransferase